MKTVTLDAPSETRLNEAVKSTGLPAAQIVHDALDEHCKRLLSSNLQEELADVIGTYSGDSNFPYSARQSEEAFAAIMDEKEDKLNRRTSIDAPGRSD